MERQRGSLQRGPQLRLLHGQQPQQGTAPVASQQWQWRLRFAIRRSVDNEPVAGRATLSIVNSSD